MIERVEEVKPIKGDYYNFKDFVSILINDTYDLLIEVSDELYKLGNKHMARQFETKADNILSIYRSCEDYKKETKVILNKIKELRKWVNQFHLEQSWYVNMGLDEIIDNAAKRSGINA